ncbi:MAG: ABC transporter permease subunit [Anaerolinea sp.]|nr:ABC transporter permease subunit [Anaerolinea sp.]MCC6974364.1 ABC transporter permease subunit [Anaerolineae bacterium]CAG0960751.1 putative transmembrane protein YxlG [Anaerolineae bacterium]
MSLFRIQLLKELHEVWATRKAIVFLITMLVFGLMAPITAKLLPELVASLGQGQNIIITVPPPTVSDSLGQFVKNTNQLVAFIVLLLAFLSVVSERERGLMTLIFPHALPRDTFIVAKFVVLALLLGVGLLVEMLVTWVYTALLFSPPDIGNFVSIGVLLYLNLLVMCALALLASTLAQTTLTAAAITFGFVVVSLIAGLLFTFAPSKLGEWATLLAAGLPSAPHWDAVATALVLIVGAIAISCWVLRRQEIISATGT